ncbi:hypothetical protein [Streptomyces venezuelae]|uniref:hypothetical protein n=1 Tax=Streptomyces venezuelae TaxID=54571 RepID=UPI001CC240C0|nr:hypothetical protein [Streptomyces venezuelae]
MAAASADVAAFPSQTPTEKTLMTSDDALDQFRHLARERAFGRHVGSDRLIQAGLDALIAGVESPSLAMLAGLLRSEEPEAPELFDQVLEELGLLFHPPADRRAAKWAMAYWIAGQIADGSLDPAVGTHLIWADIAYDLGYPEELKPRTTSTAGRRAGESPSRNSTEKRLRQPSTPSARGLRPRRGTDPGFVLALGNGQPRADPLTQRGRTTEPEPEPYSSTYPLAGTTTAKHPSH